MNETENIESFHKIQKFFLDKITELCKENDIELLLIDVPSSKSWSYEKHNAIQDYADENGLKFIDFNINRDSFGIDWNTDTRDERLAYEPQRRSKSYGILREIFR